MNVVGIIAEYNPFHQGHAYQIEALKKICHAEHVVIAMSGNFVQRGAPALMEKYSRAAMALNCGADLVLELPALFATASAEAFARGGVFLLDCTGIVTHLGFGAETADMQLLSKLSRILLAQPSSYLESLQKSLRNGRSFPAARADALNAYFKNSIVSRETAFHGPNVSGGCFDKILASPNNILALEYLKALADLSSPMLPIPILRQGSGYHDTELGSGFCSASAIRAHVKKELSSQTGHGNMHLNIPASAMPKTALDILEHYPHPFLFEDDYSSLLHYELLNGDAESFSAWGGSSAELACRLQNECKDFTDWTGFCHHMKTRNMTYARISRLFTHMLLHITKRDYETIPLPSYLRILGFRNSAAPLLSAMKSHCRLPIITRPAKAMQRFTKQEQRLLSIDLRATELYRLGLAAKGDYSLEHDFRRQILRI